VEKPFANIFWELERLPAAKKQAAKRAKAEAEANGDVEAQSTAPAVQ